MIESPENPAESKVPRAINAIRAERRRRDEDPARAEAITAIERSVTAMRRHMSRRAVGRRAQAELGFNIEKGVVEVVDVLQSQAAGGTEPSVGSIGEGLGVDASQASRMVAEAVAVGYVERVASQGDGRRIVLRLTEAGRSVL